MTNHDGRYVLSESDKRKIEAHARSIAKKATYDGAVEAWFDSEIGVVHYMECVGSTYYESDKSTMEFIYSASTNIR